MALFDACTCFSIRLVFERKRSDIAKEQNARRGHELTRVNLFQHQKSAWFRVLLNQDY